MWPVMGPAPAAREQDRRAGGEFLAFRKETTLPFPEQFISVLDKTPSIFTQVGVQMICFQLHSPGTLTHMVLSVTPPREAFRDHQRNGRKRGQGTHTHVPAAPQQRGCSGAFSKQTAERATHRPSTSACSPPAQANTPGPGGTQRGPEGTSRHTFSLLMRSNIEINVQGVETQEGPSSTEKPEEEEGGPTCSQQRLSI